MKTRILILGGYGAAGRPLARKLLEYVDCKLIIAGRQQKKAEAFKSQLLNEFPQASVEGIALDAKDKVAMTDRFREVDLVIVTATIPDLMKSVAEAALETETDLMDILVRGDVVDQLMPYEAAIRTNNRRFITQGGFHPGMVAPIIKLAKSHFDDYQEARVYMAMDPIFETPQSMNEVIYEVSEAKAMVLENGHWKRAAYTKLQKVHFPVYFGQKNCYPLPMREIQDLDKVLGISNCGVYAGGFGPYIDYVIFSLALVLGKISTRLSQYVCSRMFYHHIKNCPQPKPRVEFMLKAKGTEYGEKKEIEYLLSSEDGYELTAQATLACLLQYFDNSISEPGLYLMGQIVEEERFFKDLEDIGVRLLKKESSSNKEPLEI